jgi:hypothetical protein
MRRNPILTADILQAISDKDSLELFSFIANKKAKRIDTNTLQKLNGLSKKQYYLRMRNLTRCGIVKRTLGLYQLTSFGKVIYSSKLKIDAAIKSYWALKAVDSFVAAREMNSRVRKQLIDSVIRDDIIKNILLSEN